MIEIKVEMLSDSSYNEWYQGETLTLVGFALSGEMRPEAKKRYSVIFR